MARTEFEIQVDDLLKQIEEDSVHNEANFTDLESLREKLKAYIAKRGSQKESNPFNSTISYIVNGHKRKNPESQLKKNSQYNIYNFKSNTDEILNAIKERAILEGVDVFEFIQKKDSRFTSLNDKEHSFLISEVISDLLQSTKPLNSTTIGLGKEKRIQNADEHARNLFEILNNMDDIKGDISLRKIAKILNEKGISTARGGDWHVQTIQKLYERWEKLGLKKDQ